MDMVNTPYWVFEFLKVLFGYLLVEFLWPRFVFSKYLSGKSLIYQFGFCITAQTVLINTVVLGLGLLHVLNAWTVRAFFFGVPLAVLWRRLYVTEERTTAAYRAAIVARPRLLLEQLLRRLAETLREQLRRARPRLLEYLVLGGFALYALVYFSWGAFQTSAYGFGDQYVHHAWIYGLTQGQVFSGGVYPEAMHCLLYAVHTLVGVELYSLVLFFGGIQAVAFFAACYCLLRELFHWRFTPIIVLVVFTIYHYSTNEVRGLARLQWALPLEFALPAQMLCVFFLLRYLRSGRGAVSKGKFWTDEDLLGFTMALAMICASHFHAVIMAFFLCLVVVVFHATKIREWFFPLTAAVLCGVLIAVGPMAAGLASGIPMERSIDWAVGVIRGADDTERRTLASGLGGQGMIEENTGTIEIILSYGDKALLSGYSELADGGLGGFVFILTAAVAAVGAAIKLVSWCLRTKKRNTSHIGDLARLWVKKYLLLAALSFAMMVVYIAPYLKLPELIVGARLVTTTRTLLFAVAAIPLDLIAFALLTWLKSQTVCVVSFACLAALCACIYKTSFHEYLYCELTRYRADVALVNHIVQSYPEFTYTIVSPTDGLYQMIEYGWHEELIDFVNKTAGEKYKIPTEHVFLFIEKKPLEYAQNHVVQGPAWLALPKAQGTFTLYERMWSIAPDIISSEISQEAAQGELKKVYAPFDHYSVNRTAVESRAYCWCQRFAELYPNEMDIYYEDEEFVCYYFRQEPYALYDLAIPGE